jgi:cyclopropane-fatty-acyl-phospholipid synthase
MIGRRVHRRPVAEIAAETLAAVAGGQLASLPVSLRFWDGSLLRGSDRPDGEPAPVVTATRPRALAHLIHQPGELGIARGYVDGSVVPEGDLEQILSSRGGLRSVSLSGADRLRLVLGAVEAAGPSVLRRPPLPAIEAQVGGRQHSIGRDREAVRHHYDVSNDFYRLVLGETMVYSCAYFADRETTLEQAQSRKLDLICRKLDLHPGEELLDIGCGWGSLVIHAARHYGVRATGVTLSEPQAQLARERATALDLADRIEIRVCDYRELRGRHFDKIASVGMYEHVGRAGLDTYVRAAFELLRPGGLMLNHGITQMKAIADGPDSFMGRYIFPDGELHPVGDLLASFQAHAMEVRDVESLREHYPLTLRAWVANLRARYEDAQAMVGPERARTWVLYMLGSALAFDACEISVYQVLAARQGAPHGLPLDRLELLQPRAAAAPVAV